MKKFLIVILYFMMASVCIAVNNKEQKSKKVSVNNPIVWSDIPDLSAIRVGDSYYMVSTTMFFNPGVPVMKSKDMYSWEIIGYLYDTLADNDRTNLVNGKHTYSMGTWAASLRYHNGTFYVCVCSNDQGKTYIFRTDDIEKGEWKRNELQGIYHDPALLFEGDKAYVIYGEGNIRIKEFNTDLTGFKEGGVDQILFPSGIKGLAEGTHAYKIGDYYYFLLITWPGGDMRTEVCYRSKTLLGEYEKKVVLNSDMGYRGAGVAQGGIVDSPDGKDWYGLLFQDHGGVGRIPVLVPVTWEDNWPIMGVTGKAPKTIEVAKTKGGPKMAKMACSDEFNYKTDKLNLLWQWNHNPDNSAWSLTERKGHLRIKNKTIASNILAARNSLSQRTEGPKCESEVMIDLSAMKEGDRAGIAALQFHYGELGVEEGQGDQKRVYLNFNGGDNMSNCHPIEKFSAPISGDKIYLKMFYNFSDVDTQGNITTTDKISFSYSTDGKKWIEIPEQLQMTYRLDLFIGYRTILFSYPTKQTGGHADFDYYHYKRDSY